MKFRFINSLVVRRTYEFDAVNEAAALHAIAQINAGELLVDDVGELIRESDMDADLVELID